MKIADMGLVKKMRGEPWDMSRDCPLGSTVIGKRNNE
jgi:hypothetical protein